MAKTATKVTAAKTAPRTAQRASAATPAKPAPKAETQRVAPKDVAKLPATARSTAPAVLDERTAALPAFMQQDAGRGLEKVTNADLEIPRLKLIQGVSPELSDYDDLRAGHFFHTASETIFDEPFRVVPIYFDRQYILWNPLDSGGGILARAADGVHWSPDHGTFKVKLDKSQGSHEVEWTLAKTVQQSGLANWGTQYPKDSNSPPAATLMYNFLFAFPDYPDLMPAAFTFQRSSIKAGRKFLTKLKTVRTPIFGTVYEMSAIDEGPANKEFKAPLLRGAGLVGVDVGDEAMYNVFKDMFATFSDKGLNIKDIDSLADEDGDNATDDNSTGNKPGY